MLFPSARSPPILPLTSDPAHTSDISVNTSPPGSLLGIQTTLGSLITSSLIPKLPLYSFGQSTYLSYISGALTPWSRSPL